LHVHYVMQFHSMAELQVFLQLKALFDRNS
jgi:hypothetical protein